MPKASLRKVARVTGPTKQRSADTSWREFFVQLGEGTLANSPSAPDARQDDTTSRRAPQTPPAAVSR